MLIQVAEDLSRELRTVQNLRRDKEDYRHAQLLNLTSLIMNKTVEQEKRCAEFQNDIHSIKSLMKVRGGQRAFSVPEYIGCSEQRDQDGIETLQ